MILRSEPGTRLDGKLTYLEDEYSFRFDVTSPSDLLERAGGSELASVSIGTLQIEVGVASHRALFAWGLHPRARWIEASLPMPKWVQGAVILGPDIDYVVGVSARLSDVGAWKTSHDPESGWLRVSASPVAEGELIEIASGILLGSSHAEFVSVWLRPHIE